MTRVSELLNDEIVIQDPDREDRIIFNVPVYIKKEAVNLGGFQAFAKAYGWTETVEVEGQQVPNPVKDYEKCTQVIWDFIREVFKAQMTNQFLDQAKEQADLAIGQLVD